jgi:hypothetical protein
MARVFERTTLEFNAGLLSAKVRILGSDLSANELAIVARIKFALLGKSGSFRVLVAVEIRVFLPINAIPNFSGTLIGDVDRDVIVVSRHSRLI